MGFFVYISLRFEASRIYFTMMSAGTGVNMIKCKRWPFRSQIKHACRNSCSKVGWLVFFFSTHDGLPTLTKGVRRFERHIGDDP